MAAMHASAGAASVHAAGVGEGKAERKKPGWETDSREIWGRFGGKDWFGFGLGSGDCSWGGRCCVEVFCLFVNQDEER